jgi:hypothetical protein
MTRSSDYGMGAATIVQVAENSEEGLCLDPVVVRSYEAYGVIQSCGVRSNHCYEGGIVGKLECY